MPLKTKGVQTLGKDSFAGLNINGTMKGDHLTNGEYLKKEL